MSDSAARIVKEEEDEESRGKFDHSEEEMFEVKRNRRSEISRVLRIELN